MWKLFFQSRCAPPRHPTIRPSTRTPARARTHTLFPCVPDPLLSRLCAPNDKPPYLCILIAPASRYIFHSFPVEEINADKAFVHILEGIVMAVVTEGMGMIDEVCVYIY